MVRITAFLFFFYSCNAFCIPPNAIALSASLGAAHLSLGNSTLQVTATETDNLLQRHNPWVGEAGLGLSYVFPLTSNLTSGAIQWFPRIRPEFNYRVFSHQIFKRSAQGIVEQYQDPEMNEFNYSVSVTSHQFMADVLLTLFAYHDISVFTLGGLGASLSTAHYQDFLKQNGMIGIGNIDMQPKTNSHFAQEAGLGLEYAINAKFIATILYLYHHTGTINTGTETAWVNCGGCQSAENSNVTLIQPARFSLQSHAVLLGLRVTI